MRPLGDKLDEDGSTRTVHLVAGAGPQGGRDAAQGAAPGFLHWWHEHVVETVDHRAVVEKVHEDAGWSSHFALKSSLLFNAGMLLMPSWLDSPGPVGRSRPVRTPSREKPVRAAIASFSSYESTSKHRR